MVNGVTPFSALSWVRSSMRGAQRRSRVTGLAAAIVLLLIEWHRRLRVMWAGIE
jgi:hypothetical protein